MSKSTNITLAQLKEKAGPEVARLLEEVTAAVNNAPDGAIISGSEEQVRDAMERFRKRVFELGIQLRTDAAKAAFSPSGRCGRQAPALQGGPGGQPADRERDDSGGAAGVRDPGGRDPEAAG
jgi:hypothetical protein